MKISVIGVGIYSLAIAKELSKNKNNQIMMWTESNDVYKEFKKTKKLNSIIECSIPKNISISSEIDKVIEDTSIIYIVTGSKFVNIVTKSMKKYYKKKVPVVIASKGIDIKNKKLLSDIVKDNLETTNIGVLSGPTFAIDIINDDPVALTLATKSKKVKDLVKETLGNDNLKIQTCSDMMTVELCGALKNVYAIGAGIINGLGYKESTTTLFINEAFTELRDIIYNLNGVKSITLSYAVIGDLYLTCSSSNSRNHMLGYLIGKHKMDSKVTKFLETNTVEGYNTLKVIYQILHKKKIKAKILVTLNNIFYKNLDPKYLVNIIMK